MSHKHYINETVGNLKHVIKAKEMLAFAAKDTASPFKKISLYERTKKNIFKICLSFFETVTDNVLYVENNLKELAVIEPRTRSLLLSLIKQGIIKSWTIDVVTQIQPYLVGATIELNSFITKNGDRLKLTGATGSGTGYTLNEALIPALAELLERYSTATPNKKNLCFGSRETLGLKNTIDLDELKFFTEDQRKTHLELERNVFDNKTELHWVKSKGLYSERSILIPAQLVYYFMSSPNSKEPFFFPTNSSGVAAHTNNTEAKVRALLEIIERDAFFLCWLTHKKTLALKKETIQSEEIQKLIKNIEDQNFKLTILSVTTEFNVPIIVSVISGSTQRNFVSIGASCEFDLITSLRKSLFEAARVAQFFPKPTEKEMQDVIENYPIFTSFKERYAWWTLQENKNKINQFITNIHKEINCSDIIYPLAKEKSTNTAARYLYLKTIFKQNNINAYLVDITSKESKDAGLYVQRAVVPSLIPAYFKEYAKPLYLKRLYKNPNQLIESAPHPFL